MKIIHLSYALTDGSGIAANRLVKGLNEIDVQSEFIYFKPYSKKKSKISWVEKKFIGLLNIILEYILPPVYSINLFSNRLLKIINSSDADVIHLHWINAEMLSIKQIARIEKPLVWTFHDMWPFCAAEHYVSDDQYINGYSIDSSSDKGWKESVKQFINRWVYSRKSDAWSALKLNIVCPSTALGACAEKSALFSRYPVNCIANGLDLNLFRPFKERNEIKARFNLPIDRKLILFGSSGNDDIRKGFDLLVGALGYFPKGLQDNVDLVIFGGGIAYQIAGFNTHWVGKISDPERLSELYNTADVMCVPSRQESFGQTASESLACGVPVVAFGNMGLLDIVDHKQNGYLAKPFDSKDFADGIRWVLEFNDELGDENLAMNARDKAIRSFSDKCIAKQYLNVYQKSCGI